MGIRMLNAAATASDASDSLSPVAGRVVAKETRA